MRNNQEAALALPGQSEDYVSKLGVGAVDLGAKALLGDVA